MVDYDYGYCKKCGKRTWTVYNDFMVAFCSECHTVRGDKSDYVGQPQPFKCIHCGQMMDGHPGQTVCDSCQRAMQRGEIG